MSDIAASSKKIRVAHLLSGNDKVWGGVENYVHNLVTATNMNAIHTTVICTESGIISQKFISSKFDVRILPIKGYFDLVSIARLSKLLQANDIDLVHAHLGLDSFVGAFAAKLVKKPIIVSVHFDQPNYMSYNSLLRQLWNTAQKFKNTLVAHFLPITENVASELMKRESVPREKITIIYPGIPTPTIDRSCRMRTRTELGCDESDLVVVAVGRLEQEKNLSCLIESIAKIKNSPHVKVWLIGEGSQRQALMDLVERLNLQNSVTLLGYRTDVQNLLASADIFVLPSKAEAFGMAAVEAMIAELPVISTLVPGPRMIVEPEVTGILVPPDDSDALAEALDRLIEDPDLRQRFASAGKKRALSLFTSEAMSEKIVKVYEDVFKGLDKPGCELSHR